MKQHVALSTDQLCQAVYDYLIDHRLLMPKTTTIVVTSDFGGGDITLTLEVNPGTAESSHPAPSEGTPTK